MASARGLATTVAILIILILCFIMSSPSLSGNVNSQKTSRVGTVGLNGRVREESERGHRDQLAEAEEAAVEDPLAFGEVVKEASTPSQDTDRYTKENTGGGSPSNNKRGDGRGDSTVSATRSARPHKKETGHAGNISIRSSGESGVVGGGVYYQRIIATPEDEAVTAANEAAMAKGGAHYFAWLADTPTPITPWKPGKAKPITCAGHGDYYSAHFSIPPENLMPIEQLKSQLATKARVRDWSTVIPYAKNTYVFKEEADYRNDMEISKFGVTRRKLGFATMRNLELLAAGTIPYFCSADHIPKTGTLSSLPLGIFRMVNQWPGVHMRCDPKKKTRVYPINKNLFNETQYEAAALKLLQWTHLYQRTDYHALYVLSATSLTRLPKSVLVLWASHYTILLTTIIHGLVELGVTVIDVPRRLDTYRGPECEANKSQTYAKGWFFFCKVNESQGISRENVEERIRTKEFDLVLISVTDTLTYHMKDVRMDIPYFDAIVESYPRDRVLTINDADLIRPMQHDVAHKAMNNMSLYFKRETHGCDEDIMFKKM